MNLNPTTSPISIFSNVRQKALRPSKNPNSNWATMAIVLDAITEVLQQQSQHNNVLAYFGAFLSALEKETKAAHIAATLQLIFIVSPHVPVAAFRMKFDFIAQLYVRLLTQHERSEMIVKQLLTCVTWLLQSQENEMWASNELLRSLFQKLLLFSTDSKSSVRSKTKECLEQLLNVKMTATKPAMFKLVNTSMIQLTMSVVETCTTKEAQKMIDLLILLQDVLKLLSSASILSISRQLLKLLPMKNPQLCTLTNQVFNSLFSSSSQLSISSESLSQLLQVLQNQQMTSDVSSSLQFIKMLKSGFIALQKLDDIECSNQLNTVVQTLLSFFQLDQHELAATTSDALKSLIQYCISDAMISEADPVNNPSAPLLSMIQSISNAINYKNRNNLDSVLAVQEQLFKRLGRASYPLLNSLLISIEQLNESPDFHLHSSLEKCIVAAVSAMGPRKVLELLPLNLSGNGRARTYLFPILKRGIRNTDLAYFAQYFAPLATQFLNRSNAAAQNDEKATAKNYKNFYDQTYALLPGFVSYCPDFGTVFPKIAKHLGIILSQDKDLQSTICLTLLKAIGTCQEVIEQNGQVPENVVFSVDQAHTNIAVVAKFARNYLPILFTVYGESNEQLRSIISETIASICSVSTSEIVDEYFKQVLKKLLEAATELNKPDLEPAVIREVSHKRDIMVDLALAMAPCLSSQTTNLLYQVFQPQLRALNHSAQKKAYKAINTICKKQRGFVLMHLDSLITTFNECLPVCDDASKNYRIKCLMTFVELMNTSDVEKHLPQFFAEAIMNVRGKNKKTKDSSFLFIRGLVRKCAFENVSFENIAREQLPAFLNSAQQQRVNTFFQKLLGGLAASSDTMIGGTIMVLSSLLVEYSGYLESILPDILQSVFILMQYDSNDVILGVVSFVKTCLAIIDDESLKLMLPQLLPILVEQSSKKGAGVIRPRVTYLLQKMIDRFGFDFCKDHFPQDKLSFIKNIWKGMKREAKKDQNVPKKKLTIAENDAMIRQDVDEPLDLLDPSMMDKITTKKSLDRKNNTNMEDDIEIKTNKQGKFVINESDSESDEVNELEEKKKAKLDKKKDKRKKKRAREDVEVEQAIDDFEFDGEEIGEDRDDRDSKVSHKRTRVSMEDDDQSKLDEGRLAALKYLERKQEERKRKKAEIQVNYGEEYRSSRRAGGDVKRSGKADPYAYIPLDPKRLNRRFMNKASSFQTFDQNVKQNKKLQKRKMKK